MNSLYRVAAPTFKVFSHLDALGKVKTLDAPSVPMLSWPDGRYCWEANAFLDEMIVQGKSVEDRGGSLMTYAAHLSHLVRYCFLYDGKRGVPFIELTDNDFTNFIRSLLPRRAHVMAVSSARTAETVRAIGQTCLRFLMYVGTLYGDRYFVGPNGRIVTMVARPKARAASQYERVTHRSFPTGQGRKARLPIRTGAITALRKAAFAHGSVFLKKRRSCMLTLLEISGGRRIEIARLTVSSVRAASLMAQPMLKLLTAKKRGKPNVRYIPISRADLKELLDFIQVNRRGVVRASCGIKHDDDRVFVSELTGRGLTPGTITLEVSLLRRAAGLAGRAHPHLFRHRRITKLLVSLIEAHHFLNPGDFRRALIDKEGLMTIVKEFTGLASIASLEPYVHLAFDEVFSYAKTAASVWSGERMFSALNQFRRLREELRGRVATPEDHARLLGLAEATFDDLEMELTAGRLDRPRSDGTAH